MEYLKESYNLGVYYLKYAVYQLQEYGWFIIFGCILLYFIYSRFLKSRLESIFGTYENYKKQREEKEYSAKYHKNPDLFAARISAQQEHAQKLQEKYNQLAKEYEEKQKMKEEKKRQEILEQLDQEGGHRLGTKSDDKPKSLRPDYNPLMGPGGSSNYRPPKRSKCGGGGCGK